jgi:WD40 repeat protein
MTNPVKFQTDLDELTRVIAHVENDETRTTLQRIRAIVFAHMYSDPKLNQPLDYNTYHYGMTIAEIKALTASEQGVKRIPVRINHQTYSVLDRFLFNRRAFAKFLLEKCIDVSYFDEEDERKREEEASMSALPALELEPLFSPHYLKYVDETTTPPAPPTRFPFTKGPSICQFTPLGDDIPVASASVDRTTIFACSALPGQPARLWTSTAGQWTYEDVHLPTNKQTGGEEEDDRSILAVSHHESLLLTSANDGKIYLWEKKVEQSTHSVRRRYEILPVSKFIQKKTLPVWSTAFASRGLLFSAGSADGTVGVWNTETGTAISMYHSVQPAVDGGVGMGSDVAVVAWHPTAQYVLASPARRECYMWDIADPSSSPDRPVRSFAGCPGQIVSLAVDPSHGKIMLGGSSDGTLYVWDVASARLVRKWNGAGVGGAGGGWGIGMDENYAPISSIAWSSAPGGGPDDKRILVSKGDRIYHFSLNELLSEEGESSSCSSCFRTRARRSLVSFVPESLLAVSVI